MRRRATRSLSLLGVLFLVAALGAFTAPGAGPAAALAAASAGSSPEEQAHEASFIDRINALRNSRGLGSLQIDPELTAQARRWTDTMAADGNLRHASDLSVGISARWTVLGENVGVHTVHDIDRLFRAFVDSPGHLANLTDARYNRVGVGVVHAPDGRIWTTHRFMATPDAAPNPPPTPPATAPPPTAPPPTAPPTTNPPPTAPPPTNPPPTAPPPTNPPATAPPPTNPRPTNPPLTNAPAARPSAASEPGTAAPPTNPPVTPTVRPTTNPHSTATTASAATVPSSARPGSSRATSVPTSSPSRTEPTALAGSPPQSADRNAATRAETTIDGSATRRLAEILTEVDASGL